VSRHNEGARQEKIAENNKLSILPDKTQISLQHVTKHVSVMTGSGHSNPLARPFRLYLTFLKGNWYGRRGFIF
jgi:hypothetical protein